MRKTGGESWDGVKILAPLNPHRRETWSLIFVIKACISVDAS